MKLFYRIILLFVAMSYSSCSSKMGQEPSRLLPIEGAYNVRDLGGYKAANNKTVKWRKTIRSGDLHLLTDTDLAYFNEIPIRTYIDFRDTDEINLSPDRTPASLTLHKFLPIGTGNIIDMKNITPEFAETALVEANKFFVKDNQETYKEFFQILMNEENTPLLFHCSAGKDRAGFGAALFLASLGVDRETIMTDYLMTNECLKEKYADIVAKMPALKPLFEVRKEYLLAAFEVIDNEYGGMESYLTNQLEVDLQRMRELYTE